MTSSSDLRHNIQYTQYSSLAYLKATSQRGYCWARGKIQ